MNEMKLFTQVYRYHELPTTLDVSIPEGWRVTKRALAVEAGCVVLSLLLEPSTKPDNAAHDDVDDEDDGDDGDEQLSESDLELANLIARAQEALAKPIPMPDFGFDFSKVLSERLPDDASVEEEASSEEVKLFTMSESFAYESKRLKKSVRTDDARARSRQIKLQLVNDYLDQEATEAVFAEWRTSPPLTAKQAVLLYDDKLDSMDLSTIIFYRLAYEVWCQRQGVAPALREIDQTLVRHTVLNESDIEEAEYDDV